MGVARLLRAGLARENFDERWLAIHQQVERGMNTIQIVERIEAFGSRAQFAGGLRAAEQEDADQGDLVPVKIENVGEAMFELRNPGVGGGGSGETLIG